MDVELPIDAGFRLVAAAGSGDGFLLHLLQRWDAPTQALFGQNRQLNLRHVEPTGVLGREVPFDPRQHSGGHFFPEGLDQRFGFVGVQIVEHQRNVLRAGVPFQQIPNHMGEVRLGAPSPNPDVTPTRTGFTARKTEQVPQRRYF